MEKKHFGICKLLQGTGAVYRKNERLCNFDQSFCTMVNLNPIYDDTLMCYHILCVKSSVFITGVVHAKLILLLMIISKKKKNQKGGFRIHFTEIRQTF